MNRRDLLRLLGISGVAMGVAPAGAAARNHRAAAPFPVVPAPLPLANDGLSAAQQRDAYREVRLEDRLVVPDGYRAELLAAWGDPLAGGRFGFNNDHLAFNDLGRGRALLTVNFEYISAGIWREGFAEVTGAALPFQEIIEALAARGGRVDALSLPPEHPLRQQVLALATAAMEDLGIGVIEIERQPGGGWRRTEGRFDRRITGLSGLEDPSQRLGISGPAAAVMRRAQRLGYDDRLGDRIIGSFANCAGGETPWGTVLSAEENVQDQVVEAVYADGSSPAPATQPFGYDGRRLGGLGNPFALTGNKYGWMVEIDPRRPEQPAVKHSWLGRFRHEAVAVRAVRGQPLIVYSGCDRHGGHLYRFVSNGVIENPRDPANSRLFADGRLEVARFEADGSGRWIPLAPDTPVAPGRPSLFSRFDLQQPTLVPHSDRSQAGAQALDTDTEVDVYARHYRTLADLYPGDGEERMGAILIDAHLAANAAGATAAARPEDTAIDPTSGDLLIAFTAGGGNEDGRADPTIFRGPEGQPTWPYGWIMRLSDGDPHGMAAAAGVADPFRWRMVATGGAPWEGGLGFSNPDNLTVDRSGAIWMVTDRSSSSTDLDLFGNNSCWVLPARGAAAGQAFCFATGPMECELTGPCFDREETTLFLAVQHPGEAHGTRPSAEAQEAQTHRLVDRDGVAFEQRRWVPLGSNWPSGVPGRPPRPGVVAIRRLDGRTMLEG
jgi:secreted PhoX family phosphatase